MLKLDHNELHIYKILGYSNMDELDKAVKATKNNTDDLKFFLAVYNEAVECRSLSVILNALTGLELDTPSKTAEYIMKVVIDETPRSDIVSICIISEIRRMTKEMML